MGLKNVLVVISYRMVVLFVMKTALNVRHANLNISKLQRVHVQKILVNPETAMENAKSAIILQCSYKERIV